MRDSSVSVFQSVRASLPGTHAALPLGLAAMLSFALSACGRSPASLVGDMSKDAAGLIASPSASGRLDHVIGGVAPRADNPGVGNAVALLGTKSLCTGAIISDDIIVTAGHCLLSDPPRVVVFGSSIRSRTAARRRIVDGETTLKSLAQFPNRDVAWVRFSGGLPEGYHAVPVLSDPRALRKGDPVVVDGFGVSSEDAQSAGRLLTTTTTYEAYHNDRDFQRLVTLGPNPGRGTCHGDSGGPAYVRLGGRWFLLGTTSGRNKELTPELTCEAGHSVQNFTGAYLGWIRATTREAF